MTQPPEQSKLVLTSPESVENGKPTSLKVLTNKMDMSATSPIELWRRRSQVSCAWEVLPGLPPPPLELLRELPKRYLSGLRIKQV